MYKTTMLSAAFLPVAACMYLQCSDQQPLLTGLINTSRRLLIMMRLSSYAAIRRFSDFILLITVTGKRNFGLLHYTTLNNRK